jgi:esterase
MKLFYRQEGEGQPLIILHGLFGMSDNWYTLGKEFAANNFSVYLPDARNHGRSPHAEDFNYDVMAEDIVQLMKDENISSASFIGHSMGGKTAMFFAAQHAEQVQKLIVTDMAPRGYESSNEKVVAALRAIDLNKISSRKEAEEKLRSALNDEVTTQFLLKSFYWKEGEEKKLSWRFNVDAIAKNLQRTGDALPDNAIFIGDTLFIRGEKSNYITQADEPLIKKHFPNSEIKTVAGAGHWVHAENPKGFMEAALDFLGK